MEVEHMQRKDFVDDRVEKLIILAIGNQRVRILIRAIEHDTWNIELAAESASAGRLEYEKQMFHLPWGHVRVH